MVYTDVVAFFFLFFFSDTRPPRMTISDVQQQAPAVHLPENTGPSLEDHTCLCNIFPHRGPYKLLLPKELLFQYFWIDLRHPLLDGHIMINISLKMHKDTNPSYNSLHLLVCVVMSRWRLQNEHSNGSRWRRATTRWKRSLSPWSTRLYSRPIVMKDGSVR